MRCIKFYWMQVLFLCSVIEGGRKKVDLMYSKERTEPNTFWPVFVSVQDMNSSSSSVLIHGVRVVSPGPMVESTPLDAIEFTGSSLSYLEVPNTYNNFDGALAMCWEFYLYFEENQDSVLLEYEGTVGGIQLRLIDRGLKAILHTSSGHVFEHHVTDILDPFVWRIVGINFNKNWDDEEFDIFTISDPSSEQVDETILYTNSYTSEIILDAVGSIRIGQDHHSNSPFKGQMSCFQFYDISIYKKTSYESGLWCDPAVWNQGYSGEGMKFAEEVTTLQMVSIIPTTMVMETSKIATEKIEPSTIQQATDQESTSQITEDVTIAKNTITDKTTEKPSTAMAMTSQRDTIMVTVSLALHVPTTEHATPIEKCMRFSRIDDAVLIRPFVSQSVSNISECAHSCTRFSQCIVFSLVMSDCHMGTSFSDIIPLTGNVVYRLT